MKADKERGAIFPIEGKAPPEIVVMLREAAERTKKYEHESKSSS